MYWYFVVPDGTSCEEAFERVLHRGPFRSEADAELDQDKILNDHDTIIPDPMRA